MPLKPIRPGEIFNPKIHIDRRSGKERRGTGRVLFRAGGPSPIRGLPDRKSTFTIIDSRSNTAIERRSGKDRRKKNQ